MAHDTEEVESVNSAIKNLNKVLQTASEQMYKGRQEADAIQLGTNAEEGADEDWFEQGTSRATDDINDNVFTKGNVGIGILVPTEKLDVATVARVRTGIKIDP